MNDEDLDQPLAERRGRRENRQLPKRYQDMLPEPPAALPPAPPARGVGMRADCVSSHHTSITLIRATPKCLFLRQGAAEIHTE